MRAPSETFHNFPEIQRRKTTQWLSILMCRLSSKVNNYYTWPLVWLSEGLLPFFWYDTDFLDFKKKKKFWKFLDFFLFFGGEKSVSYQKKGRRGPARLSFFWYDNDSGHKGPFRVTQSKCFWSYTLQKYHVRVVRSVRIYAGSEADPYRSAKICVNLYWTELIHIDPRWSAKIFIDAYLGSMQEMWFL